MLWDECAYCGFDVFEFLLNVAAIRYDETLVTELLLVTSKSHRHTDKWHAPVMGVLDSAIY